MPARTGRRGNPTPPVGCHRRSPTGANTSLSRRPSRPYELWHGSGAGSHAPGPWQVPRTGHPSARTAADHRGQHRGESPVPPHRSRNRNRASPPLPASSIPSSEPAVKPTTRVRSLLPGDGPRVRLVSGPRWRWSGLRENFRDASPWPSATATLRGRLQSIPGGWGPRVPHRLCAVVFADPVTSTLPPARSGPCGSLRGTAARPWTASGPSWPGWTPTCWWCQKPNWGSPRGRVTRCCSRAGFRRWAWESGSATPTRAVSPADPGLPWVLALDVWRGRDLVVTVLAVWTVRERGDDRPSYTDQAQQAITAWQQAATREHRDPWARVVITGDFNASHQAPRSAPMPGPWPCCTTLAWFPCTTSSPGRPQATAHSAMDRARQGRPRIPLRLPVAQRRPAARTAGRRRGQHG